MSDHVIVARPREGLWETLMHTPFQKRAIRALSDAAFFGELGSESMRFVHRTAVQPGDVLFEKGDPSEHLFGVVSGQLKAYSAPSPGHEVSLELIAPGELVGHMWVVDGEPRYASVKALAHCELATVSRHHVNTLLDARPELGRSLRAATAATVARLAQRAEDIAFLSIESRLEKALVDLASRFGEAVEQGIRVRLRQQDLADVLGVSRESVSRALAAPGLRGRLALGRGSITLLS